MHLTRCRCERSTGGAGVSTPPVEVGLEKERGRDGISRGATTEAAHTTRDHRPIRLRGRETLILDIDRNRQGLAQVVHELSHAGGGLSLGAVHAHRQPDHNASGGTCGDAGPDLCDRLPLGPPDDDAGRLRNHPAGIGDGDADPLFPDVERQNPHRDFFAALMSRSASPPVSADAIS